MFQTEFRCFALAKKGVLTIPSVHLHGERLTIFSIADVKKYISTKRKQNKTFETEFVLLFISRVQASGKHCSLGSIRFLLLLLTQALNLNIQIALIAIFYVRFVTLIFIDSIAMVKHTKSQLAL